MTLWHCICVEGGGMFLNRSGKHVFYSIKFLVPGRGIEGHE